MKKTPAILLLATFLYTLPGCVSIPAERLSVDIEACELSDHVYFLAQPALKGRKPKTLESQIARRYLTTRFAEYDLVPYPGTKSYELSFRLGTNVVGVLPGSDPNVNDEIIILAAHYDHVGPTKKGVCLGACDNASGVAALLEIAEQISLADKPPRRPVCFACFDCEEQFTLGSLAFTCQDHFDQSKVAAMINIDLLGRDFLDIIPNSLFVVGTEQYPELRDHIRRAGSQTGLDIFPIGTDLVGPRGDHVAFETMPIPVLFFTCGIHKDYHKPTDTPEKLDYTDIQSSAGLIADTVLNLANADTIKPPDQTQTAYGQELEALAYVLGKIDANLDKLELTDEQKQNFQDLNNFTHQLTAQNDYTTSDRRRLLRKTIEALLPTIPSPHEDINDINSILCSSELYSTHRHAAIDTVKRAVKHFLNKKPNLFGKYNFSYKSYDLIDDEIIFVETEPGQYELHVLLPHLGCRYRISGLVFKRGRASFSWSVGFPHCTGTREEITDYCLLIWSRHLKDESFATAWQKVMHTVTKIDPNWSYGQWLNWRLDQGGWSDEEEWLEHLDKSSNRQLAALTRATHLILTIKQNQFQVLQLSIARKYTLAAEKGCFEVLLPFVDDLDNETPDDQKKHGKFPETAGPFIDHPCVADMRDKLKNAKRCELESPTPADLCLRTLRELTGQKFGKDKRAWRKWIEEHSSGCNAARQSADPNEPKVE